MDLQALNERLDASPLTISTIDDSANPPVERPEIQFSWQDLDNRELNRFAETHRIDELLADTDDEFEQLLRLRHWAYHLIPHGSPEWTPDDPNLLVDVAAHGRAFYCSHYASVLMYAATAMGWPARHIGIDCDHAKGETSTHHGVTEVFCLGLGKWLVLDAMYDIHFEHAGQPLNALEIRDRLGNAGPDSIDTCKGPHRHKLPTPEPKTPPGFNEPGCYFWSLVRTRNDHFTQPTWQGNARAMLYIDDVNRDKRWYQGDGDNSHLHSGYGHGDKFSQTERLADIYPDLGRTHLDMNPDAPRPQDVSVIPLTMVCLHPYWRGFEVRFDQATPWTPVRRRVDWRLHAGHNVVEARAVTANPHRGPIARIELTAQPSKT